MELTEDEISKISYLLNDIITSRGININVDWGDDFSKEHDFYELLGEIENYIELVSNYEV